MRNKDKKVCKINDDRLSDYKNRTRNGSEQIFYTGNDERDFDRYRAEGGNSRHGAKMHDKPDTIRLKPPEKHYYAELISGEWWWLNGCAECNGQPRDWMTYVECDKHNVCRTCKTPRSEIKGPAWGGKDGWQCEPCKDLQHETEKQAALAAMPEEYDNWDFHGMDEITCPHCAYEFSDSWEHADDSDEDHTCPRCDNAFTVTAVHSLTFDCSRIETDKEDASTSVKEA